MTFSWARTYLMTNWSSSRICSVPPQKHDFLHRHFDPRVLFQTPRFLRGTGGLEADENLTNRGHKGFTHLRKFKNNTKEYQANSSVLGVSGRLEENCWPSSSPTGERRRRRREKKGSEDPRGSQRGVRERRPRVGEPEEHTGGGDAHQWGEHMTSSSSCLISIFKEKKSLSHQFHIKGKVFVSPHLWFLFHL